MGFKHILRYCQSQEDALASIPSTFYQPTIQRLLKKYNFVIANEVKQSLIETAKLVLNLF